MPTATAVAHRLYDAFANTDPDALLTLLSDDFEGTVSTGMPHGVGGMHEGRSDMLGVWLTIYGLYDMRVEPIDYLQVDEHRVVVIGRYHGPARDGNSAVDAAFAHVITTRDDHIVALQQITDTARGAISSAE
jgi:uncharacterized protein